MTYSYLLFWPAGAMALHVHDLDNNIASPTSVDYHVVPDLCRSTHTTALTMQHNAYMQARC